MRDLKVVSSVAIFPGYSVVLGSIGRYDEFDATWECPEGALVLWRLQRKLPNPDEPTCVWEEQ
jgi:hypothetical protein